MALKNRNCVFGNEVENADVHDPRISLLTGIHSTYDSQSRIVAGRLKLAFIGTINNLNPYVDKGLLSPYINPLGGLGSWIYDPLMRFSEDELASYYGWLAEHVEVADDFSWVTYKLRENARWHDSLPVTMADVMWTFDVIKNGAVDFLVEKIAVADSEESLNAAGRALDRILLYNFYLIPDGHPIGRHVVHWDRFGHPPLGVPHMNWTGMPYLWWFDKEKSARVDAGIAEFNRN